MDWSYQPLMPQALGSSGGQLGTGIAPTLAMVTVFDVFAVVVEICVDAAKPVRAKATTKARTMVFMMTTPKVVFTDSRFFWTISIGVL